MTEKNHTGDDAQAATEPNEAEIEAWIRTLDDQKDRNIVMWMERALRAEKALAAQPPAAPVDKTDVGALYAATVGAKPVPRSYAATPPEVMERRRKGLPDYEKPPLGQPPAWLQEEKKQPAHSSAATDGAPPWWKMLADNWRGRNGNTVTGDSVRNSCADELEKVAARHHTVEPQTAAWLPVETAPHEEEVLLGWWSDYSRKWECATGYASHGWSRNGISTMSRHGQATHWQPLPAGPSSQVTRPERGPSPSGADASAPDRSRNG